MSADCLSVTTRPRFREALGVCRGGDVRGVTKFDRLAHSLHDATAIAYELTIEPVALNIGGAIYDSTGPEGLQL